MRRAAWIALLLLAGSVDPASANGRFPATVGVRFQPGNDQLILMPATFGLLLSRDDGATWQWVCENAIGYTGTYDPDYAIAANGDIYATTFDGLRVSTDDGCTWDNVGAPLTADKFINQVEIGPDGRVWATTSTGGAANDVFVSAGGGAAFESSGLGPTDATWWLSIATTVDDDQRIYVSGYVPQGAETPSEGLLRRSIDGGASWEVLEDTALPDFTFGDADPLIYILGASPTNADVVFARAVAVNPPIGDAVYRSSNGGQNWTKVLDLADSISAFTIRADGQNVIVGTIYPCPGEPADSGKGCVRMSNDGGATFDIVPAQEPQMACVGERSDGTLFACGSNFDPDRFGLGTSTDGQSWTPLFRFNSLEGAGSGPLECPAETEQAMTCEAQVWPTLACATFMLDIDECELSDAGPLGDGGGLVKVDALTVPATGELVEGDVVLEQGVEYEILATGTYEREGNYKGDAEYFWLPEEPMSQTDASGDLDVGLRLNGEDTVWGAYTPTHIYQITIIGNGEVLSAELQDVALDTNSGSLSLTVYGPEPSSDGGCCRVGGARRSSGPPPGIAVLLAAWLLFVWRRGRPRRVGHPGK